MPTFEAAWSSEELSKALCDLLVAKGQLKEKPAFIRTDREAKIAGIFSQIGLDGAKMETFDNPGPLEMMIRKGTNQEAWVQQVIDVLVSMLPEEASKAKKEMGMSEEAKEELEAAKEKTASRRERQEQETEEQGAKGGGGGGGKGRGRDRDDEGERGGSGGGWDAEERSGGGWGGGQRKGGNQENMECFNCSQMGHSSRDCPEPRKENGKGKGKGADRKDRGEMQCNNCKQFGHRSRDCTEPVDEEAVRQRLAARSEKEASKRNERDD